MVAPRTAARVRSETPSQRAHSDHERDSSSSVSPTSKTTARISLAIAGTLPGARLLERAPGEDAGQVSAVVGRSGRVGGRVEPLRRMLRRVGGVFAREGPLGRLGP